MSSHRNKNLESQRDKNVIPLLITGFLSYFGHPKISLLLAKELLAWKKINFCKKEGIALHKEKSFLFTEDRKHDTIHWCWAVGNENGNFYKSINVSPENYQGMCLYLNSPQIHGFSMTKCCCEKQVESVRCENWPKLQVWSWVSVYLN